MKSVLLASIAFIGVFGAAAFAADMPAKAPVAKAPLVAPPYNWNGFYVGANFGGGWTTGSLNIAGGDRNGGLTEFIAGVQAGYNFQLGHLLLGVEGDFDWAVFNHPASSAATSASVNQRWISTVAGRVGLVNDRWLVFAKFGAGWVHSNAALTFPGGSWNGSNTDAGWLVGGGIEYGFKPHWTVKLEYDYIALSNLTSAAFPAVTLSRDVQLVKAGISYKFESGVTTADGASASGGSGPSRPKTCKRPRRIPVAALISVPFQSNTNFNAGPFNRAQEVFNIQPVVPMSLNDDWNIISRTIIPLLSQPSPLVDSNTNGIGDITQSLFLSPAKPGALIWGVGPVFTVPSATDPILGTGKFLFGPTAVFLTTPGHWVIGVLINNQWSVGGDPARGKVNTFLAQPFINYNMAGGWYLTYVSHHHGELARGFRVSAGPCRSAAASVACSRWAISRSMRPCPDITTSSARPAPADWQLRIQVALLFPT